MDVAKLQAMIARLRVTIQEIEVQRNIARNDELTARVELSIAKAMVESHKETIETQAQLLQRQDAAMADLKRKLADAEAVQNAPELPMQNGDDSHCPA